MRKLVIKRSKWLRGGKNGRGAEAESCLLDADGHKCCLGFYMKACGFKGAMTDVAVPSDLKRIPLETKWLKDEDTLLGQSAKSRSFIGVNDDEHITDKKREEKLTKLFKKQGVAVTFVD